MHITQLWRHPVKSFQGEQLQATDIEQNGLRFDRAFGVIDLTTGKILTARREPKLLFGSAFVTRDGQLCVSVPGVDVANPYREFIATGRDLDAALSEWLVRDVALVPARDHPVVTAENFDDALDDDSPLHSWELPEGRFVDSAPLLLITTATLETAAAIYPEGRWDVRRFRPNIVLDTPATSWLEDNWRGLALRIGTVELTVRKPCTRCTMVTRAQPGIPTDLTIYRSLAHVHGATFGVLCDVRTPGRISIEDEVELVS